MKSKFPSFDLPDGPLAFDASVLINFLGTDMAGVLLGNLGRPIMMATSALGEVKYHPIAGRNLGAIIDELKASGLLTEHPLDDDARIIWRGLVDNDLATGLDDGEATTIALAVSHGAIAVIDERKAVRILAELWPGYACVDTVTLLAHAATRGGLDGDVFAQACFNALTHARMRVPSEAVGWLVDLIGHERALECNCLRRKGSGRQNVF